MKKVLNGVLYDSDRAKQIGIHANVSGGNKIKAETLYKTADGHYFIFERDMMNGVNITAGKITPLSPEESEAWAKKHLGEYPYNAEFGAAKPDKTPKMLNISHPSDLVHKLEQLRKAQGKTVAQIIESLINKEEGQ